MPRHVMPIPNRRDQAKAVLELIEWCERAVRMNVSTHKVKRDFNTEHEASAIAVLKEEVLIAEKQRR